MSGQLSVGRSDVVVMGGDSIFYQLNWIDIVRFSNARYGIGKGPIWVNAGQGGSTSGYGASNVAAWTAQSGFGTFSPIRPTRLICNLSVNDWDTGSLPLSTSQANLTTIITTAAANLGGAQNVLYVGSFHTDPATYANCASYNAGMKSVCDSLGAVFLDTQALWLAREAKGYRDPTLQPDLVTHNRVHPQYTFMTPETTMTGKQIYASWLMTAIQFVG